MRLANLPAGWDCSSGLGGYVGTQAQTFVSAEVHSVDALKLCGLRSGECSKRYMWRCVTRLSRRLSSAERRRGSAGTQREAVGGSCPARRHRQAALDTVGSAQHQLFCHA